MVTRLQKKLKKWLQTYETRQLVLARDIGAAPCSYIRYSRSCGNPNEMHVFSISPSYFCTCISVSDPSAGELAVAAGAALLLAPRLYQLLNPRS